ncbi:MAG: hypothetical protein GX086_13985 [Alcaligenaceae bacterium]|nr:hypothetical protein [Alcaligenaceae bacterium]
MFVRSGKLKALGVTSGKRTEVAPELPTMDDSGLKGFSVTTWYGVWAPAKTPPDIIKKLKAANIQQQSQDQRRLLLTSAGPGPALNEV